MPDVWVSQRVGESLAVRRLELCQDDGDLAGQPRAVRRGTERVGLKGQAASPSHGLGVCHAVPPWIPYALHAAQDRRSQFLPVQWRRVCPPQRGQEGNAMSVTPVPTSAAIDAHHLKASPPAVPLGAFGMMAPQAPEQCPHERSPDRGMYPSPRGCSDPERRSSPPGHSNAWGTSSGLHEYAPQDGQAYTIHNVFVALIAVPFPTRGPERTAGREGSRTEGGRTTRLLRHARHGNASPRYSPANALCG